MLKTVTKNKTSAKRQPKHVDSDITKTPLNFCSPPETAECLCSSETQNTRALPRQIWTAAWTPGTLGRAPNPPGEAGQLLGTLDAPGWAF